MASEGVIRSGEDNSDLLEMVTMFFIFLVVVPLGMWKLMEIMVSLSRRFTRPPSQRREK